MSLTLDEYSQKASQLAEYNDWEYPFYALAEEAGEVCGKMARYHRGDSDYNSTSKLKEALKKELGDVLWQWSQCCKEAGLSPEEVAYDNLCKLWDRKKRGVIKGEGDKR